MKLTKILAGLLLVLAVGLALMAWVVSKETPRDVRPVAVPQTSIPANESVKAAASKGISVLVAAHAIAAGQRITDADIKVSESVESTPGAFAEPEKLIGQTTLIALMPGQAILEPYLVAGLSLQLEGGQRAVSIAVKEAMAAGNHIRPGDFVDVFFTLQEDGKETKVATQTRLLLARARVLAYGTRTVENPPESHAQRKAEQNKEGSPKTAAKEDARSRGEIANTAVLAVPLEDVQRLTLAEKYGQLNLALRHPDDVAVPDAALFAQLPVMLRPAGMGADQLKNLTPIDRAYAGLRLSDLAEGGSKSKAVATAPRQSSRPAAPRAGAAPAQTIELLHGSHVQTVSY